MFKFALPLLLSAAFSPLAPGDTFDVVIRGGRVIDGTGNPAYFADVAVRDGRIVQVGRIEGKGKQEIDARGKVVTPGFIDVHTHAENIARIPRAENFVRMGVTSIVIGNCGGSESDLGSFFEKIDRKVSINVASLIGHNTVRRAAMGGNLDRAPTESELTKMRASVEKAMQDGAVGLSTGLIYLPGTYSNTEEIVELAKVASRFDGIYASHMRSEGAGIFTAIQELMRIAREANIRAQISHIKLSGNAMWGRADEVLKLIETARAEGLDITQDQYMYTASSTSMSTLIPSSAREGTLDEFRKRISDSSWKAKLIEDMKRSLASTGRHSYGYAVVASYAKDRSYNGKSVAVLAKQKHGSDSLDAQIEVILDMHLNGGASGVFHGMSEEDLRRFLSHPNTMIASDAGVREPSDAMPHPRGYGNSARVISRYVREHQLLRLEDAVRRMTSLPATAFRLTGRGLIREGAWADMLVFAPDSFGDLATYDEPHQYAVGLDWMLVNGVPVVAEGEQTDALPGRPLRLSD